MGDLVIAKFGGTSLADAAQVKKVVGIVRNHPHRKVVVVSAPGKRHAFDNKVTDILIDYRSYLYGGMPSYTGQVALVRERFADLAAGLGLYTDTSDLYRMTGDMLVSRGEYYMATMLAEALDYQFVDATCLICFKIDGSLDMSETVARFERFLPFTKRGMVIPGFYGEMPDGSIRNFSRGGSDITGAIAAAALGGSMYENWTDVSGVLMADPTIVENPRKIEAMTYREMRELAYAGARVLHDEAVFPVREAGIPICIRNTNDYHGAGTMIVADDKAPARAPGSITGIAGRKHFTVMALEKANMNNEVGYVWKLLGVLKDNGVGFEHLPGSIDSVSVVIDSHTVAGKLDQLIKDIKRECNPDRLSVTDDLSLICTVGHAMAHKPGVLARLAQALAEQNINVRMMDQGASEISIIVGVTNSDYARAVRAIYEAFT